MHSSLVEGRRFLICHSIVHDLIGSTIVTLDLATFLEDAGGEVLVYATFVGDPAMSLFADRGIEVVDDAGIEGRSLAEFDVVWIHSQVLPEKLVDELLDPLPATLPSFVFLHMSSIHYAPDEHPYIHRLEERLSSLSLFISTATRRVLLPFFDTPPQTGIYPNPTPEAFARKPYTPDGSLERVMVVSNHADPELMRAKRLLADRGLDVRHIGRTGDEQTLVTPEVLADADVVITIGKTAQYCLVAGRPVYVYDHFGGYGYLDDENLSHAQDWNYSGRFGEKRSAEQIADELVAGFRHAVTFHAARRDDFVELYSIDHVVPRVLSAIEPRQIEPFEPSYHRMVRSAQAFGARFFHYWGHNANEVRNRERLTSELEDRDRRLDQARAEATALRDEIVRLEGTWSFRVGRLVVRPVSALVRGITWPVRRLRSH